jgi:RNA polymerase sigma factor (sigma-70 family)
LAVGRCTTQPELRATGVSFRGALRCPQVVTSVLSNWVTALAVRERNVRPIFAQPPPSVAQCRLGTPVDQQEPLNSPRRLAWEAALLQKARQGDRGALATLYRAYAGSVFTRVLMPKLGNKEAAEDALSETFRVAFERLTQYEQQGTSIYFWIARIAGNKAMDMHRAKRVTGRAIVDLQAQVGVLFELPETPDALLSANVERRAFRERLTLALSQLNPRYRQAIELRFFQELSREECALKLEVKVGTFDVLLLRAIKALRKEWDDSAPNSQRESERLHSGDEP